MRSALLTILFAFFALLIVSAGQIDKKQINNNVSSCQTISIGQDNTCIIPAKTYLTERMLIKANFIHLVYNILFVNTDFFKFDNSKYSSKLNRERSICFKLIKQKPFLFVFYFSSEKEDYHHLS
jgi:hypothetical protein